MTKRNQIYKCEICGNIVEILHAAPGQLVCCKKPMGVLTGKKAEEGVEKHLPVVGKITGGVIVKVGSVPHPMEEKHWIEWIELVTANKVYRKILKPGKKAVAEFKLTAKDTNPRARAYCNVHGLWQG